MPTIEQARRHLTRTIEPSGRVRDLDPSTFKRQAHDIGEVVSLSPPQVELLNGDTATLKFKAAGVVTPQVGDLVLLARIGPVLIAVDTVEVI